ncbi:MAG: hypothetical protein QNJ30_18100 [Kiloniellales bacterium]|nr:hypothetical protein [Kiloniellales bacterium]
MAQKEVRGVVPVNPKLLQRGSPSDYHEFIFQWLCYELELLGAEGALTPERRAAAKRLVAYVERLSSRHVGFGIVLATRRYLPHARFDWLRFEKEFRKIVLRSLDDLNAKKSRLLRDGNPDDFVFHAVRVLLDEATREAVVAWE